MFWNSLLEFDTCTWQLGVNIFGYLSITLLNFSPSLLFTRLEIILQLNKSNIMLSEEESYSTLPGIDDNWMNESVRCFQRYTERLETCLNINQLHALVLTSSKELDDQIYEAFRRYGVCVCMFFCVYVFYFIFMFIFSSTLSFMLFLATMYY